MDRDTASPPSANREENLFRGMVLALAAVVGVSCWFAAAALSRHDGVRGIRPDHPRQLADFTLTDSIGRSVTRAELEGKIVVASFLFTSCGTTCPEVSRRMAEIQRLTASAPDVRLISLSVDPRTDTPPVLAKWGARYGADTNYWLLLTGARPVLHTLIGVSFLATNASDPFNSMPGNFTGTERIAVVDRHGQVRLFFDGTRLESAAAVVAEIEQLRKEP